MIILFIVLGAGILDVLALYRQAYFYTRKRLVVFLDMYYLSLCRHGINDKNGIDDQSQPISTKRTFTFNLIIGIVCLLKEFHQKQNNEKKICSPLHLSLLLET